MNSVAGQKRKATLQTAAQLHKQLFIADLHADSLLWNRDLLKRGARGHVDVPRLQEGNVALQAFTVVTKTPRNLNIERNDDSSDDITALAIAQRWPPRTWKSLLERAVYQAERLREFAENSGGKLIVIRSAADLDQFVERRRGDGSLVAGVLGLEGAHALEGKAENLHALRQAGFRMIGLTHFFDNEFVGSAHGVRKGGLTEAGRELVKKVEANGMIIDLAHASPVAISDVLAVATRPVVVSHTGVRGTCDNTRNLSDAQLRGIARGGGIVGIGYWSTAVCGKDARAIARAIRHAVNVMGAEHVALGSDYDGAIQAPFDTSGISQITEALLAEGVSPEQIRLIMGANVLRLLRATLPRE